LLNKELGLMSSLSPKDRSRSPRFPSQALEDSLRHARLIYEGVHRSSIDSETAFRLMGFSGKTGTSSKALGSLRQYGLIEGTGEKTRVSDLALTILEPESELEKSNALAVAARRPDVFEAIMARFSDRVPQADEPIRAFLIRELGFQKGSADECIKSLRQSLVFADVQVAPQPSGAVDNGPDSKETGESSEQKNTKMTDKDEVYSEKHATQSAYIPLTRDCKAELRIYGPLSDRAIENLLSHVQLLAQVWSEE
jgi:hypothetical protein